MYIFLNKIKFNFIHSFIFSNSFPLVKVAMDPEPILGLLDVRQECYVDQIPVHHTLSYAYIHILIHTKV